MSIVVIERSVSGPSKSKVAGRRYGRLAGVALALCKQIVGFRGKQSDCLVLFTLFWPQKTSELASWTSKCGRIAGKSGPTHATSRYFYRLISHLKIPPMAQPMVFDVGSTPFAPLTCIILLLFNGVGVVLCLPYC